MYLKVVVTLQVSARFQKTGIKLYRLRTRIAFHPEEHLFLYFTRLDICAIYNDIIQSHSPNFLNFCICKYSVHKSRKSVTTGRLVRYALVSNGS